VRKATQVMQGNEFAPTHSHYVPFLTLALRRSNPTSMDSWIATETHTLTQVQRSLLDNTNKKQHKLGLWSFSLLLVETSSDLPLPSTVFASALLCHSIYLSLCIPFLVASLSSWICYLSSYIISLASGLSYRVSIKRVPEKE
jgi:hypothetical protein